MKNGCDLISEERQRQEVKEGYSSAHDDAHNSHELAFAAVCYALPAGYRNERGTLETPDGVYIPAMWPWSWDSWKPGPKSASGTAPHIPPTKEGRIRELIKAGALIAAEIDRLRRR